MPAGTPTATDSFFLSQSTNFKQRVQTDLIVFCNTVETEAPTGVTGTMPNLVHQARASFVKVIQNPANFTNWLTLFVQAAAADGNVISAATVAATNYTPITTIPIADGQAADGQSPIISRTLIQNAIAAAFNTFVPGI